MSIRFLTLIIFIFSFFYLQAIEKDRLLLISPDIQSSHRPTQQLTYRLDVLQKELNKKSEEASYFQTNFYGIKENMVTKNDENKELRGKILTLEEKNLNLEQELSSYRILHLDFDNKENKVKDKDKKDKKDDKDNNDKNNEEKEKMGKEKKIDEKKVQFTQNNPISNMKYAEIHKNIVSPES